MKRESTAQILIWLHLFVTMLLFAVWRFLYATVIPQFALITTSFDQELSQGLLFLLNTADFMNRWGWLLVIVVSAWPIWQLIKNRQTRQLISLAYGVNVIAFSVLSWLCVECLLLVQGTLLPLLNSPSK
jgi:uncharacterized membrane protein